jgi:hypothetical protein
MEFNIGVLELAKTHLQLYVSTFPPRDHLFVATTILNLFVDVIQKHMRILVELVVRVYSGGHQVRVRAVLRETKGSMKV